MTSKLKGNQHLQAGRLCPPVFVHGHQLPPNPNAPVLFRRPSPTARLFSSHMPPSPAPRHPPCHSRPPRCPGSADRHMTQPPRRPTATAETSFLGATSIPNPRSAPATPLPDVPPFLQPPPPPPPRQQQQAKHHRSRPARLIRSVRAAFRSFPILPAPSCRGLPSLHHLPGLHSASVVKNHFHGSTRTTGTLYGHRRARITIAFHDSPGSPPGLLLEMGVPTAKFIQDVSAAGMVRVTLECDKQQHQHHHAGEAPRRLLDEPVWVAEVNGESVGYAARREATEGDEGVMRLLHSTSMGAGVLPADMADPADGELTYMRAHFDRVVGSKDAETYYMHNPEGCATGPELTIFFIRT